MFSLRLSPTKSTYNDCADYHFHCCHPLLSPTYLQGYITMAQARHAMGGPKTVSSLQYDAVMRALATTEISEDTVASYDDLLKRVESTGDCCVEFKINRIIPGKPVKRSRLSDETVESAGSGGSTVRQRKNVEDSTRSMAQGVQDLTRKTASWKLKDREEAETFESKEEIKDPIKWFGILVPQSLRQSQQHFITGVCM